MSTFVSSSEKEGRDFCGGDIGKALDIGKKVLGIGKAVDIGRPKCAHGVRVHDSMRRANSAKVAEEKGGDSQFQIG